MTFTRRQRHTGAKRLIKLADFLRDNVKPEQFDIDGWGYQSDKNACDLGGHCGTVGCAAGWATRIPEFRRAGFRSDTPKSFTPHYKGYDSFSAVDQFFYLNRSHYNRRAEGSHIDSDENRIFTYLYYASYLGVKPTKANVIKEIRKQAARMLAE